MDIFAGLRVMQPTIFRLDIEIWRRVYQRLECNKCREVIAGKVTEGILEIEFPQEMAEHTEHVLATINEYDWIHNNWDKENGIVQ